MAKKFLTPLGLVGLASDPATGSEGQLYFNTTDDVVKVYSNGAWAELSGGGSGSVSIDYSIVSSASAYALSEANYYTDTEVSSLNIFSSITTNPSTETISADSNSDTLTFIAGENITISASGTTDSITINSTGNYTNVNSISTPDYIQFDTTANTNPVTGLMGWDSAEGTLNLGLSSGKHIHLGEESVFRVRNSTGSTIGKGTALYASGVESSGRIQVTPYVADGSVREVRFMGLATESISSGVNGFVQHFGYVRDLDTRGTSSTSISVGDENWSAGDILYVHPTVPGKLTNVKPQHEIVVAIIIIRHQTTGILFVRPSSSGHLEDIHDISISSPQDNDILLYNNSSSVWQNESLQTYLNSASVSAYNAASGYTDSQINALTTSNIEEGTNLYFTNQRAINAASATYLPLSGGSVIGGLTISGNLYVAGSATYIDATNLNVTDSVINLSTQQQQEDVLDQGFTASYGQTGDTEQTHKHRGLVYDKSDNKWKLFSNVSASSISTTIDFTNAQYETIKAGTFEGNIDNSNVIGLSATYLTQTDASNTYLTQSAGLTAASASSTYLSQSGASSLYLTQSSASSSYVPQNATGNEYIQDQAAALFNHASHVNASATYDDANNIVIITANAGGGGGGGYSTIEDNDIAETQRTTLNLVGFNVEDNAGATQTDVTNVYGLIYAVSTFK
jgi:hypothetical protein